MNSLAILAALTIVAALYAVRRFQLQAAAATQRADHMTNLWQIVMEQRDAARKERDDARNFADEALMISGLADAIARHPGGRDMAVAPALSIVRGL